MSIYKWDETHESYGYFLKHELLTSRSQYIDW